ncbi:DUF6250 domain-containing protein [Maribacter polysaccharolyticus]|uniref:DUF6250 domain-containing protein n=1 Tax=Maribacter polysaccharolyticus TaxID=3020831 RepID=UPI00237F3C86|nr:DUF6250 domain-containing protein [Maribacter polysaccharolyticus]MDE3740943.1 DUF6250 domain-containing protein [Maribacter polysaccharolyticus]
MKGKSACTRAIPMLMLTLFVGLVSCAQGKYIVLNDTVKVTPTLLYEEDFDTGMDNWVVEQMEGGKAEIKNGKLEINDVAGCTIWFKKELEGSVLIEYDTYIIDNGGPNDRVSDMNCFWMAKDMEHPENLFEKSEERGGKFTNYDSLRLYYMGVGGHDNSKTRFRRYVGNGERPLLPEYDFTRPDFLLAPNQVYHIKIIAHKNFIRYYRDDVLMVDFYDANPYLSGYFGLRTVNNHMTIDNFKVYKLIEEN